MVLGKQPILRRWKFRLSHQPKKWLYNSQFNIIFREECPQLQTKEDLLDSANNHQAIEWILLDREMPRQDSANHHP